jgi:nicotinamide phosphoribosyltransferase
MKIHKNMTTDEIKQEAEYRLFKSLLKKYPTGIVSIVSDTWDYWHVITETAKELKDDIMSREADSVGFKKTVFRPDSGIPENIICGDLKNIPVLKNMPNEEDDTEEFGKILADKVEEIAWEKVEAETPHGEYGESEVEIVVSVNGDYYQAKVDISWDRHDKQYYYIEDASMIEAKKIQLTPQQKGSVECLDETFGHTLTEKGYKVLDEHVGLIYGDSITPQRAFEILDRLEKKGYASSNIVLGVGSYTYQFLTRDSLGFAIKATYGVIDGEGVQIYKEPKTDSKKNSAKGMMRVELDEKGEYYLVDGLENDEGGCLQTIFKDGKFKNLPTYEDIRNNLSK